MNAILVKIPVLIYVHVPVVDRLLSDIAECPSFFVQGIRPMVSRFHTSVSDTNKSEEKFTNSVAVLGPGPNMPAIDWEAGKRLIEHSPFAHHTCGEVT